MNEKIEFPISPKHMNIMLEQMSDIIEYGLKDFFSKATSMSQTDIIDIVENRICPKGIMKKYVADIIRETPFEETLYFQHLVNIGEIKLSQDGTKAVYSQKFKPNQNE